MTTLLNIYAVGFLLSVIWMLWVTRQDRGNFGELLASMLLWATIWPIWLLRLAVFWLTREENP